MRLEQNGFEVDAYTDPIVALASFKPSMYDILILDIRMRDITGIQLFKEIKSMDANAKVLFFFTAFEIQEKEWHMVPSSTKVNWFVKKPVMTYSLIDAISQIKASQVTQEGTTSSLMVRGSVAEISRKMQDGDLLEPGGHNMLTLRHLFVTYAKTILPKNEILLFVSQYIAVDNLKNALQESWVNVARHLADGTLFIIDAQKGYQVYTRGMFKLAMSLISRARKEGRRGITWLGDMGSFF